MAGQIIKRAMKISGTKIFPVDSILSCIWQMFGWRKKRRYKK